VRPIKVGLSCCLPATHAQWNTLTACGFHHGDRRAALIAALFDLISMLEQHSYIVEIQIRVRAIYGGWFFSAIPSPRLSTERSHSVRSMRNVIPPDCNVARLTLAWITHVADVDGVGRQWTRHWGKDSLETRWNVPPSQRDEFSCRNKSIQGPVFLSFLPSVVPLWHVRGSWPRKRLQAATSSFWVTRLLKGELRNGELIR